MFEQAVGKSAQSTTAAAASDLFASLTGTRSPSPSKTDTAKQSDTKTTADSGSGSNYDPFSMMGWAFNKPDELKKDKSSADEEDSKDDDQAV